MRIDASDVLVVVFGAAGRLGTAVVNVLHRRPGIAVARVTRTGSASGTTPGFALDVTDVAGRTAQVEVVCGLAAGYDRVVLLDAVLDKSSVLTMRTSLRGAADLIIRAAEALRRRGHTVRVVAASTTAVLAPRLYQTPYGAAKREQLHRYASAGVPGSGVLLPMLRSADQRLASGTPPASRWLAPLTSLPRVVWDYQRAAELLAASCTNTYDVFLLSACDDIPSTNPPRPFAVAHRAAAALAVAPLTIAAWTIGRHSPHLRRVSSYGRLFVTPPPIRRRIDHHLIPPSRVAALAHRLGTPVMWTTP
jgi:hypothetical protein